MTKSAWYIGCKADEVGDSAILIGDPGRIPRIAKVLERSIFLDEKRGLRTVTGWRNGRRITATAFGMGAPIATIVLQELRDLGVHTFLRIGTAQVVPPAVLGDFVLADGAMRVEGTSGTFAPAGYPAVADFDLNSALRRRLAESRRHSHAGVFATYDGFYSQMFVLSDGQRRVIDDLRQDIQRYRILATDMETSALLTVGRLIGARVSSLCMGTVDALTQATLPMDQQAVCEQEMFAIALDSLASLPAPGTKTGGSNP
jgi:uridine phosphorylase